MTKPDGVELALLHALRYEEMKIKTSDTKERWDITDDEVKINKLLFENSTVPSST